MNIWLFIIGLFSTVTVGPLMAGALMLVRSHGVLPYINNFNNVFQL